MLHSKLSLIISLSAVALLITGCKSDLPEERPDDVVIDYHRFHPDQPLSQHLRLQEGKGQSFYERTFRKKIDRMQLIVEPTLIDTVYARFIANELNKVSYTTKGDVHSTCGAKLHIQWGGGERVFIERGDTMINPEFRGAWLKTTQLLDSVMTTLVEQQLQLEIAMQYVVDLPEDVAYNLQLNGRNLASHNRATDSTITETLQLTPGELMFNASVKLPRKKTVYLQKKLNYVLGNKFDSLKVELRLEDDLPVFDAKLK